MEHNSTLDIIEKDIGDSIEFTNNSSKGAMGGITLNDGKKITFELASGRWVLIPKSELIVSVVFGEWGK